MSLSVDTRHVGEVTILDITGDLTNKESAGKIFTAVTRTISHTDCSRLVLNLGGMSKIDDSGVFELESIFGQAKAFCCDVRLANLDASIITIEQAAKLRVAAKHNILLKEDAAIQSLFN